MDACIFTVVQKNSYTLATVSAIAEIGCSTLLFF